MDINIHLLLNTQFNKIGPQDQIDIVSSTPEQDQRRKFIPFGFKFKFDTDVWNGTAAIPDPVDITILLPIYKPPSTANCVVQIIRLVPVLLSIHSSW